MKSKYIILIIIITVSIGGIAYFLYGSNKNHNSNISQNSNNTSEYNTAKLGTTENIVNQNSQRDNQEQIENNSAENLTNNTSAENTTPLKDTTTSSNDTSQNESNPPSSAQKETEIASFSTKIYSKDSQRQNNVSITCKSLNETIVENGKTFSFCDTVGKATSSKGYQKADVFKDGEKIKALGGGNCQVSTTLYNAVLKISELKVTERHAHSNSVPYIAEGKDAAVSYGTYDFKFVNNTRAFNKNKMQYR